MKKDFNTAFSTAPEETHLPWMEEGNKRGLNNLTPHLGIAALGLGFFRSLRS